MLNKSKKWYEKKYNIRINPIHKLGQEEIIRALQNNPTGLTPLKITEITEIPRSTVHLILHEISEYLISINGVHKLKPTIIKKYDKKITLSKNKTEYSDTLIVKAMFNNIPPKYYSLSENDGTKPPLPLPQILHNDKKVIVKSINNGYKHEYWITYKKGINKIYRKIITNYRNNRHSHTLLSDYIQTITIISDIPLPIIPYLLIKNTCQPIYFKPISKNNKKFKLIIPNNQIRLLPAGTLTTIYWNEPYQMNTPSRNLIH